MKIEDDGSMGEKLNAKIVKDNQASSSDSGGSKIGYVGEMPDDITTAIFIEDKLLVTTTNEAYVMIPGSVTLDDNP